MTSEVGRAAPGAALPSLYRIFARRDGFSAVSEANLRTKRTKVGRFCASYGYNPYLCTRQYELCNGQHPR